MSLNKALLGSAAVLMALAAFPAAAQGIKELRKVSPIELMPERNGGQEATFSQVADPTAIGIDVLPASNISLDTLGIYDAKSGGLAFTVWEGSEFERVRVLLQNLPQTIPSPTIRQLLARLLLSSTRPPQSDNIQQNIFTQRIETLMHIDEVAQAQRLIELVPQDSRSEPLAHLEFTTHLLNGDDKWVCSHIGAALQKYSGEVAYWQKLSIFCHAQAKETAKVDLALDLLSEQQIAIDPGFVSLIETMTGRSKAVSTRFASPLSLDDAALIAISGKDAFPENYLQTAPLPIAELVQRNTTFSGAVKDAAAKRLAGAAQGNGTMQGWFAQQFAQSTDRHINFDRAQQEAQEKGSKADEAQNFRRNYRFYTLMQALGFSDVSVAEPWKQAAFTDAGHTYISPALRNELATAVNSELTGEAILLLAMIAGQVDNLQKADDASLAAIVEALMRLGFDKEAQAFATEAMTSLY